MSWPTEVSKFVFAIPAERVVEMTMKNLTCVAAVLLTLTIGSTSGQAAETILQYGFDYTSGTVDDQGGTITDDSGAANTGYTWVGNGGTYSSDTPSSALTQYCTGIGSLSLGGAAVNNVHTADSPSTAINKSAGSYLEMADVYNAGGLTVEAWIKAAPASVANLVTFAGTVSLDTAPGAAYFFGGTHSAITNDVWTHVAGVFTPDAGWTSGDMSGTSDLYVNGVLEESDAASWTAAFAVRGLGLGGNAYNGTWNPYTGLVYEPRVSLGALTADKFTIKPVPEPATAAMLAMAAVGLLAYAWRKRK